MQAFQEAEAVLDIIVTQANRVRQGRRTRACQHMGSPLSMRNVAKATTLAISPQRGEMVLLELIERVCGVIMMSWASVSIYP